jgi:hypothetical protein
VLQEGIGRSSQAVRRGNVRTAEKGQQGGTAGQFPERRAMIKRGGTALQTSSWADNAAADVANRSARVGPPCSTVQPVGIWQPMLKPRASSAKRLEQERFEAAMRSEPVLKLVRENASTERIAVVVESTAYRVRSWLKAHGLLRERR